MPLLFWYPMIVWSSMCSLALDQVQPPTLSIETDE